MFQIKSEDQKQKTLKRIQSLQREMDTMKKQLTGKKRELMTRYLNEQIEEFRYQVEEFDRLRQEGVGLFEGSHISQIGPYLLNTRIASGITQEELAQKIGVSQPMVYKYELDEYQGHSLEVLAKVAKALGVHFNISACQKRKKSLGNSNAGQQHN